MFRQIKEVDNEQIGQLWLDTRCASSSTLLTSGGFTYGITYSWNNIDWSMVLNQFPATPSGASDSDWLVEHRYVSWDPDVGAVPSTSTTTWRAQFNGGRCQTLLIASNLCTTKSYMPNVLPTNSITNNVTGVINTNELTNIACGALGVVSNAGATNTPFPMFWTRNSPVNKFYCSNPQNTRTVTVTVFVPISDASNTIAFSVYPNDYATGGTHRFTFSLIRKPGYIN